MTILTTWAAIIFTAWLILTALVGLCLLALAIMDRLWPLNRVRKPLGYWHRTAHKIQAAFGIRRCVFDACLTSNQWRPIQFSLTSSAKQPKQKRKELI